MDDEFIPSFTEINYDSGSNIQQFDISKYLSFEAYFVKEGPSWGKIKCIPNLLNPQLTWLEIVKKVRYIHLLFGDVSKNYKTEMSGIIQYPFKEQIESIIFHMKTVIDMQVQLASLETDYDTIVSTHKFIYDSFGSINKKSQKDKDKLKQECPDLLNIIFGNDEFEKDNTNFLSVINSLFNSMKHCALHSEAYSIYGADYASVVTVYAPSNNFNSKIEYHNHYLFQLIMGFDNNVRRIFRNMRLFQEKESQAGDK